MARPKKIDHAIKVDFRIPRSIVAKVELELYSDLEGRVPFGAKSALVTELLVDWLKAKGITV